VIIIQDVPENWTTVKRYNFDVQERILTIFG